MFLNVCVCECFIIVYVCNYVGVHEYGYNCACMRELVFMFK